VEWRLVLFAHGFVPTPADRVDGARRRAPFREHLVVKAFAWAASSYRCNGYVPGQGLVDTVALNELFTQ
jgi:hypothetical protein